MESVITVRRAKNKSFVYIHKSVKHPENVEFDFHTHTDYEIYIFLKGEASFVVEGISYKLSPYDILLIRGNELHRIFSTPDTEYERIVLNISSEFFTEWQCEELKKLFERSIESRFIPAETVLNRGIDTAIERMEKYIHETNRSNDAVVKCAIVDFIYNLGKISPQKNVVFQSNIVAQIISYLNKHIKEPVTLDILAEKFYLSKYYMCRIFKEATGFTIYQYITAKRTLLVKQLYKSGYTLSNASSEAGFGCYSNFYKAYVKQFGRSPKEDFKSL